MTLTEQHNSPRRCSMVIMGLVLVGLLCASEYVCRRLYERAELSDWGTISTEQKSRIVEKLGRDPKGNSIIVIGGPLLATGIWGESIDMSSHRANWDVTVTNLATLDQDWTLQRRWLADLFATQPPYMVIVDAHALRQPQFSEKQPYWHATAWRYKTVCSSSSSIHSGSELARVYCPLAEDSYFIRFLPNLVDAIATLPEWVGNPGWYYMSQYYRNNPTSTRHGTIMWTTQQVSPKTTDPKINESPLLNRRLAQLMQPYQNTPTRWLIVDTAPRSIVKTSQPQAHYKARQLAWLAPHLTASDYADNVHFSVQGLMHLTDQIGHAILAEREAHRE